MKPSVTAKFCNYKEDSVYGFIRCEKGYVIIVFSGKSKALIHHLFQSNDLSTF